MNIHNLPHPGEFIRETYVLPEMVLCLSKALGRSPESWLAGLKLADYVAVVK